MAERFAYVIAYRGDAFLMVRNKKRAWEMPGGRLLDGETYEAGARREFLEETGAPLTEIVGEIKIERAEGRVFVGFAGRRLRRELSAEISEVREFKDLPEDLSFPLVEYASMLAGAKSAVENYKKKKSIGRSASPPNNIKSE